MLRAPAALGLLALVCCGSAWAQAMQDLGQLNTASFQAAHGQRVVRFYAQMLLGVQPDKAASALKQSLADLRTNNAALHQGAPAAAAPLLDQQMRLIDQLSGVVSQPAAAATLSQAQKVSDELLGNAESVVKACAATGPSAPAALLSMAARQRTLSQRLAASYFVQLTPLKSAENKKRLLATDDEFKAVIAAFDDHRHDFPGVEAAMDLARMQMVFFDNAVHKLEAPTPEQVQSASTASERVYGQMDEMTRLVLKRLADQPGPAKMAKKAS